MTRLTVTRAGPLATIQDSGRFGSLRHGISASGPMDRTAFASAGRAIGGAGAALEFTRAGLGFTVDGPCRASFAGGHFRLARNGKRQPWPTALTLKAGDTIDIAPGDSGNYGYVRFNLEVDVPVLLGSRATNLKAGLGGLAGRALVAGDVLHLLESTLFSSPPADSPAPSGAPIRIVWGLHADTFDGEIRLGLVERFFRISLRLDRMGVVLDDPSAVFKSSRVLSLVSDAVVPGDIQILGDGTPIVLMRDHQPTGGYPRIATIVSADFDRFAQLRPGSEVRFQPVTVERAQAGLR